MKQSTRQRIYLLSYCSFQY